MFKILIILLALLIGSVPAFAEDVSLPLNGPTPVDGKEIVADRNGVYLEIRNRQLHEVLQRIRNDTGIQFILPESIFPDPVNVSIRSPDWPSALIELLQDYNRMEIWAHDLKKSRIRILVNYGAELQAETASRLNQVPVNLNDPIEFDTAYYRTHPVNRGDWVAIKLGSRNRPLAKQVLAVADDTVVIKNGQLWVNGQAGHKTQTIPTKRIQLLQIQLDRYGSRVPKGRLIISGHHTDNHLDNTDYRVVSARRVIGKVKIR